MSDEARLAAHAKLADYETIAAERDRLREEVEALREEELRIRDFPWIVENGRLRKENDALKAQMPCISTVEKLKGGKMDQDLENRFTYHAPKEGQPKKYETMRDSAKEFAYLIKASTPNSREQSLALTHLEEVVFWANAAIARHEL